MRRSSQPAGRCVTLRWMSISCTSAHRFAPYLLLQANDRQHRMCRLAKVPYGPGSWQRAHGQGMATSTPLEIKSNKGAAMLANDIITWETGDLDAETISSLGISVMCGYKDPFSPNPHFFNC